MSEALDINGEQFVPSKVAAKQVGYTGDYVARLARENKIKATKVGNTWFVSVDSLQAFLISAEEGKQAWREELRKKRKQELAEQKPIRGDHSEPKHFAYSEQELEPGQSQSTARAGKSFALVETFAILMLGLFFGGSMYLVDAGRSTAPSLSNMTFYENVAISVYEILSPHAERQYAEKTDTNKAAVIGVAQSEDAAPAQKRDISEEEASRVDELERTIERAFSDEVRVMIDKDNPVVAVVFPSFSGDRASAREEAFLVPIPESGEVDAAFYQRWMQESRVIQSVDEM